MQWKGLIATQEEKRLFVDQPRAKPGGLRVAATSTRPQPVWRGAEGPPVVPRFQVEAAQIIKKHSEPRLLAETVETARWTAEG